MIGKNISNTDSLNIANDKINPSLIEGALLSVDNARSLFDSAKCVADTKCYGAAISLLILSSEEAVKAMVSYAFGIGFQFDPDGMKKYFQSHKFRHETVVSAATIMSYSMSHSDMALSEEKFRDGFINICKNIINDHDGKGFSSEVVELRKWWKGANNLKNKGLYVDVVNGDWITPKDLSKDDYLIALRYVEPVINLARLAKILHMRGVPKEIEELLSFDFDKIFNSLTDSDFE